MADEFVEVAGVPVELRIPGSALSLPIVSAPQLLPLGEIPWETFERMCVALARIEGRPERTRLYGVRGQAQQGIDLYSRLMTGGYAVYQCKRYEHLTEADVAAAVNTFTGGGWAERATAFVLCTSAAAVRTELAEAIEAQTDILAERGITFDVWDREEISRRCKTEPTIVWDFFGRYWAKEFCSETTDLDGRLDAYSITELRTRLRSFYALLFEGYDAIAPVAPADVTPLLTRFVLPDIISRRELVINHEIVRPSVTGVIRRSARAAALNGTSRKRPVRARASARRRLAAGGPQRLDRGRRGQRQELPASLAVRRRA